MATLTKKKVVDDLYNIITAFIDDLTQLFSDDEEVRDLTLISIFLTAQNPEVIMKGAIENLLPHKNQIETKNIDFFNNNRYIFSSLPQDRVEHYGYVITKSSRLDEDDIESLWEYVTLMLQLTEEHQSLR